MSSIDLNLNVNFPQLAEILAYMKGPIMGALEDLQTKVAALVAANADLKTQVDEGNDKTDQLIVVATTTKDALEAVRGQLAGMQAGASAEQITALFPALDAALASANAGIAAANAQDAETDAATTAVAP